MNKNKMGDRMVEAAKEAKFCDPIFLKLRDEFYGKAVALEAAKSGDES